MEIKKKDGKIPETQNLPNQEIDAKDLTGEGSADVGEAAIKSVEPSPEVKESEKSQPKEMVAEETGVISKRTKVVGDIGTNGHLAIYGEVEGNISARGDIVATGKIQGDITCKNLKMTGCKVKTNISAKDVVILDEEARVEGKIQCKTIFIDGTIIGDIDAQSEINIYRNAKITGDIRAKALGIEAGAEIQGNIMVVK